MAVIMVFSTKSDQIFNYIHSFTPSSNMVNILNKYKDLRIIKPTLFAIGIFWYLVAEILHIYFSMFLHNLKLPVPLGMTLR